MGYVSVPNSSHAKNMPIYYTADQVAKSSAANCMSPGRAVVFVWHWKRCWSKDKSSTRFPDKWSRQYLILLIVYSVYSSCPWFCNLPGSHNKLYEVSESINFYYSVNLKNEICESKTQDCSAGESHQQHAPEVTEIQWWAHILLRCLNKTLSKRKD